MATAAQGPGPGAVGASPTAAESRGFDPLSAARELLDHLEAGDLEATIRASDVFEAHPPLQLFAAVPREQWDAVLRPWFEAWHRVLQELWYARGSRGRRGVAGPHEQMLQESGGNFPLRQLQLLPSWLRWVAPDRLNGVELPEGWDRGSFSDQARSLGRFCCSTDAGRGIDYAGVHRKLHPRLRRYWTWWLLCNYMQSPRDNHFEDVNQNRGRAARDFVEVHGSSPSSVPPDLLMGTVGYRSVYFLDRPKDFVDTLVDAALSPRAEILGTERPALGAPIEGLSNARSGVLLSCFNEHHSVRRCMDPMLGGLRNESAHGYRVGLNPAELQAPPPETWRGTPGGTSDHLARGIGEIRALAERIASDDLDFLFYPEVGLTVASRWLSLRRLARVQAMGYGHPVTSGSPAMDYFIGGREIEEPARAARNYRERLVLIPGLGCGAVEPPRPVWRRQRSHEVDGEVRFTSAATYHKADPRMLAAWGQILEGSPRGTHLRWLPAMPEEGLGALRRELSGVLPADRLELVPLLSRDRCLLELQEADIYLDSFPYAGFNSVMDALCLSMPVVTYGAERSYAACGAALIRRLNLPELLIAHSESEYIEAARRLALDPILRRDIREMLPRERVVAELCGDVLEPHFTAAVEWMLSQGAARPGPPVYIEAGEAPRELAA